VNGAVRIPELSWKNKKSRSQVISQTMMKLEKTHSSSLVARAQLRARPVIFKRKKKHLKMWIIFFSNAFKFRKTGKI